MLSGGFRVLNKVSEDVNQHQRHYKSNDQFFRVSLAFNSPQVFGCPGLFENLTITIVAKRTCAGDEHDTIVRVIAFESCESLTGQRGKPAPTRARQKPARKQGLNLQ
jgi:hypothetical protein